MLLTVTGRVYHYQAAKEGGDAYLVWQEVGGRALAASDRRKEVIREVQVEFYTSVEFDPLLERLMEVLEAHEIAFEEPVSGFDPDTGKIRHILECEAV